MIENVALLESDAEYHASLVSSEQRRELGAPDPRAAVWVDSPEGAERRKAEQAARSGAMRSSGACGHRVLMPIAYLCRACKQQLVAKPGLCPDCRRRRPPEAR
jgi:hypothetical protein